MMRRCLALCSLTAALFAAPDRQCRAQSRADGTTTVIGVVSMRDGGLALGYSVVSIPRLEREQFTNERGVFVITGVPLGLTHLRVRHLGYTPQELDVVVRPGENDTIHVALSHIAVRLSAIEVRAYPICTRPGAPDPAADSGFATVFGQLRQNADQYRLLSRAYPFRTAVERTTSVIYADNRTRRERVDTIGLRSVDEWQYKPGGVVVQDRKMFWRVGAVQMRVPTLAALADTSFISHHCFYNGGLETIDGRELVRIDFVAASSIRDPDVDGAMYLDPSNFQIRRTFLHLSKRPNAVPDLLETEATTIFSELLPSVPIISAISSVNRLVPARNAINPATGTGEEQRLIAVEFTGGRPGEQPKRP